MLTDHARKRMQQRGVTSEDIQTILDHGRIEYRPCRQAMVAYLPSSHIPRALQREERVRRATGTAVLLNLDGAVLTVYSVKHPKHLLRGSRVRQQSLR